MHTKSAFCVHVLRGNMTKFGVGDKVCLKDSGKFLGYVSHVFKGHFFLLEDPEVLVHIGNKVRIMKLESELEFFDE